MKPYLSILLIILAVGVGYGQKIGNLTVDKKDFDKYILDCYNHPDTIASEQEYGLPSNWGAEENRYIRDRNAALKKSSIGEIIDTLYFKEMYDTLFNSGWSSVSAFLGCSGCTKKDVEILNRRDRAKAIKSGIKSIRYYPPDTTIRASGKFFVPRKPSEQDFIKWKIKNQ